MCASERLALLGGEKVMKSALPGWPQFNVVSSSVFEMRPDAGPHGEGCVPGEAAEKLKELMETVSERIRERVWSKGFRG